MSLSEYKLTDAGIDQNGVAAAPDKLTGTATENKALFDRLVKAYLKVLLNSLIDNLEAVTAAAELGAADRDGAASTIQAELDKVSSLGGTQSTPEQLDGAVEKAHEHENKELLDQIEEALTTELRAAYDSLVEKFGALTVTKVLAGDDSTLPTSGAVSKAIAQSGALPAAGDPGQVLIKESGENYDTGWGDPVPRGGTVGQVLMKESEGDFDTKWGNAVPGGGTIGQVLSKRSDTDLDTQWIDAPGAGAPGKYTTAFSAEDWAVAGDHLEIVIPAAVHKLGTIATVSRTVGISDGEGGYLFGTWGEMETAAVVASNGDVVISYPGHSAENAEEGDPKVGYSGIITLIG